MTWKLWIIDPNHLVCFRGECIKWQNENFFHTYSFRSTFLSSDFELVVI
jgi:hypothetical protein